MLTRRRMTVSGWRIAVLAMLLASVSRNADAETIRISGNSGALETVRILGEAFGSANPGIRFELLPGMGSSGGVKAVMDGRLDIAVSTRPLSSVERARGVVETWYARTPFVFCVNRTLEMSGVTLEDIAAIYSGKRKWENGKRIRPILPTSEVSDIPLLKGMSPAMSAAVDIALAREGMIAVTLEHDVADAIEHVPGAFGAMSMSLILSEKRKVRVLALNGVTPGVGTLADGSYPYGKTYSMVTKMNPSAAVRRFADFVRSPAGADILARTGHQPVRREGIRP